MPLLPSGTVTFVFTDIEDSTVLLRRLGDRYGQTLSEHRRIVREVFRESGVEIDAQGDAFFFAFPRARDAVAAAADVQRAHASNEWADGAAVRVRIGLHTGEPDLGEEGYLGLDVVRAARICTAARGGHVLLSESTRALLGSALPEGVSIYARGECQLKGIEEPERVYELAIDGLASEEEEDAPMAEGVATPEPPLPPVSSSPASTAERSASDQRFDQLGRRLAAEIEQQVAGTLERELARLQPPPVRSPSEDADVDKLATRASPLAQKIHAQVEAALKAKGITDTDQG